MEHAAGRDILDLMPSAPGEDFGPSCDRADALAVLRRLRDAGHVAYFAGGCVRDLLLGREPKDWDVATDAPPSRVRELFSNTQAVGAAFGVILVRQGRSVVEVATFRTDLAYRDGRRPEGVQFATAEQDAQRRDFTINGLFLDPVTEQVIDFVGGQADLNARLLRAIGNADERFAEDHLRLLRAVRIASRMRFAIEPATATAIVAHAHQLPRISPERIADELRRMLTAPTRDAAWRLLWELRLARQVFRHLNVKADGSLDPARSIFTALDASSFSADSSSKPRMPMHGPDTREFISFGAALAAATLDYRWQHANRPSDIRSWLSRAEIGKTVRAMRQGLKISNDESDELEGTLNGVAAMLAEPEPGVAGKKRFLATPTAPQARTLLTALARVGISVDRVEKVQRELSELAAGEFAPTPLITGDDLTAAGAIPGPAFKRALDAAYDAQLEGRIATRDQALAMALAMCQTAG